ncbi:sigma-70 family RNA polymerase sigma factor [Cellvibrio japonicus]|uniref:Probable fecI Specialized sigma subunits of RNA n=1 Tax=Cellvibrio japonicus (strain Ueda107) TaxID=498211 RepID=B3PJT7_CELJU|nr:sigma-70 family RNA polymerase sigma factor [Cellvibrio japonicus]ACE84082.1 Probable fecI Specialized sigma subunits of RNA [Cellvibrio japonicus Ueda107]QEI12720.1 sigma-70 family RNA polymerase sigma factor [Cellvibrio japonicus]QEI16294.1 sigma-70 family RNA polymerase sigma factor [Cellvibrio japonicus]QEI19872.1 sigma-70 family RNA polymerase sigma factor [Cellvibrio japonicus]
MPTHPDTGLTRLYSDHHGWLYAWLRRRMGCSHNAADLAQDTYVRLLNSGRFPSQDQARPYLLQIAKGLVIDRHRRRLIEQAYLDALASQPETLAPSPEETALVVEVLVRIDSALARLKPVVRETFLLSRFEGLTYREIALRLDIAVATVRKYMLMAIQSCMSAVTDSECA